MRATLGETRVWNMRFESIAQSPVAFYKKIVEIHYTDKAF